MMNHFIVRYKGENSPSEDDILKIKNNAWVHILDASMLPKMLLIETNQKGLNLLHQELDKNWLIIEESLTPLPDTRKKINRNR
jgi:hypothetical protein